MKIYFELYKSLWTFTTSSSTALISLYKIVCSVWADRVPADKDWAFKASYGLEKQKLWHSTSLVFKVVYIQSVELKLSVILSLKSIFTELSKCSSLKLKNKILKNIYFLNVGQKYLVFQANAGTDTWSLLPKETLTLTNNVLMSSSENS